MPNSSDVVRVEVTARTEGTLAEIIGYKIPAAGPLPFMIVLEKTFPNQELVVTARVLTAAEAVLGGDRTPSLLIELSARTAISVEHLGVLATRIRNVLPRGNDYKTIVMNRNTAFW